MLYLIISRKKKMKKQKTSHEKIEIPLIDLLLTKDIVNYVFSFIIFYKPILKLVCKSWNLYFINEKKITTPLLKEIIKSNEFKLLIWLKSHIHLDLFKYLIPKLSARYGNSKILNWAIKYGCSVDSIVFSEATLNGHLNCLKLLVRHRVFPLPNDFICRVAARGGHLNILEWARENGCRLGEETFSAAASGGHLDCLKWLRKCGCLFNTTNTCSNAASGGHLDCLKWLRECGCLLNTNTCSNAASGGHLDCLKWLRENGCPWNGSTCSNAAYNGHLDCLKYAVENDCPWDESTCSNAAYNGHLDCLQWAHENGCPWDEFTCSNAARHGHVNCLKYARKNDCPFDETYMICDDDSLWMFSY